MPRETVSSVTVCSYSHSLQTFTAPRASSSELCARHLPLQRSSLPTWEVTRGTALAQEWPSKPGQGGDFLWQNRRLPHLDGGPPRNGGQPLLPRRRDRGEGCSRCPTSAAPAEAFGLDGEVRGSTRGLLCFKSSNKVFSEVEQNSSSSPNSIPKGITALTKMPPLLLRSKTTGLNPMPELVPASPRTLLRDTMSIGARTACTCSAPLAPSRFCHPLRLPGKQSLVASGGEGELLHSAHRDGEP